MRHNVAGLPPCENAFRRIARPEIPPLAWLFTFEAPTPTLYHGSGVDVFDRGFFEGCFAGEYGSDPRLAASVFGSGMWHAADGWHVITPSHVFEPLFVLTDERGRVRGVANSLPFLAEHFAVIVPVRFDYGRRFGSIVYGVRDYERAVVPTPRGTVHRYVFQNLRIDVDRAMQPWEKPAPPIFDSYDTYLAYLRQTLDAALSHARDPGRRQPRTPIGTMSSGYDSACATALAAEFGCREALTIRQSRAGGNDSGRPVGEVLGIDVHEFDRPVIEAAPFDLLPEFFASGMAGEDYHYHLFEPHLSGRVLLTGGNGGVAWSIADPLTTVLARNDTDGTSLQEFRLRTGFFLLPVPTIGLIRQIQIRSIAGFPEMAPFDVGGGYSSPIPRRVLESMGVPRAMFGQQKAATMMMFAMGARRSTGSTTRARLSAEVHREIAERGRTLGVDTSGVAFKLRVEAWHGAQATLAVAARGVGMNRHAMDRAGTWLHRRSWVQGYNHPMSSVMFMVSLDELRRRYRRSAAVALPLAVERAS